MSMGKREREREKRDQKLSFGIEGFGAEYIAAYLTRYFSSTQTFAQAAHAAARRQDVQVRTSGMPDDSAHGIRAQEAPNVGPREHREEILVPRLLVRR
jgi:hypothetical protein